MGPRHGKVAAELLEFTVGVHCSLSRVKTALSPVQTEHTSAFPVIHTWLATFDP